MAEFQDYFGTPIAYNPATEDLVSDAEFTVHAVDDLALATPLRITDPTSGVEISTLKASNIGVLPDFRADGDPVQVIIKSGSFTTKLTSVYGAVVAAGLDPATVQSAIQAGADAVAARGRAVTAEENAAQSEQDAAEHADEVRAVVATNDGIMAPILADPESTSGAVLRDTIGAEMTIALPWFNVRDFGAAGDGVEDDTAAIQATIDAAATANGGVVQIPPGTYKCSATLLISTSRIHVAGAGWDITTLVWPAALAAGSAGIRIRSAATRIGAISLSEFKVSGDPRIINPGAGDVMNIPIGVEIDLSSLVELNRVYVDHADIGIATSGVTPATHPGPDQLMLRACKISATSSHGW
ncbi:hypothetical protein DC31_13975 [Microbacterium sp. CH12i]|uniref:glycosyl hydrolase family 28-related protein n=1 Tax=Microbacterium sp. CH12i TaxID=1479651 RepID=UPI0004610738|nr:glycosyl hydrolase family 28-related protein [Microbacterium sp. CH12i]KDA05868.1 hypothetical protein DC31_13975 [Microbacterium sp. CH12i]